MRLNNISTNSENTSQTPHADNGIYAEPRNLVVNLEWEIATCATHGPNELLWGDYHFATDLANALRRQGQTVHVLRINDPTSPTTDVAIHLRGHRELPPRRHVTNFLWIISHPEDVMAREFLGEYDEIFAASRSWAQARTQQWNRTIRYLPQAVAADRFHDVRQHPSHPASGRFLLVANARRNGRKILNDCLAVGIQPLVYGANWDGLIPQELYAAKYLPNEELPVAYTQARVVLNDHWDDMARNGFASNRLFEATTSGTVVISDQIEDLPLELRDLVWTYNTLDELAQLARRQPPSEMSRRRTAAKIAERHSFDERARELIETALTIRGALEVA